MKKKKNKKNKSKRSFIIFILSILIIFNVFLIYKNIYLYMHKASKCEDYEEVMKGYYLKDTLNIKRISSNNYLETKDFKIRNDFSDFVFEEKNSEEEPDRYILDEGDKKQAIYLSTSMQIVNAFKSDEISFFSDEVILRKDFLRTDREGFLKKNKIEDDIDYLNFIKDHYYMESRWTDSNKRIREVYAFNLFTGIVIPRIKSFSIIEGDYRGYILNGDNFKEVHILENGISYNVLLIGDRFNDSYVEELISTIII